MTPSTLRHLSHSSADLYHLCGRKWWFAKVDRATEESQATAALVFGGVFHTTVERVLRARVAGTPADPVAVWRALWSAVVAEEVDWGRSSHAEEGAAGEAMLTDPAVLAAVAGIDPLVADGRPQLEVRFALEVPGVPVPVIGFIDVVEVDGVPLDVKTSGRPWTQAQAHAEMQPLIYLAALRQAGTPSPAGLFRHLVLTKRDDGAPAAQVLLTRHTNAEIDWALDVLREVWRGIDAGVFVPNPRSCMAYGRRCEFWAACRGERR